MFLMLYEPLTTEGSQEAIEIVLLLLELSRLDTRRRQVVFLLLLELSPTECSQEKSSVSPIVIARTRPCLMRAGGCRACPKENKINVGLKAH